MRFIVVAALCLSAVSLAGCGDTTGQRVVTGAAGGALAGQVVAGEPLAGAAIGGGIGALR